MRHLVLRYPDEYTLNIKSMMWRICRHFVVGALNDKYDVTFSNMRNTFKSFVFPFLLNKKSACCLRGWLNLNPRASSAMAQLLLRALLLGEEKHGWFESD